MSQTITELLNYLNLVTQRAFRTAAVRDDLGARRLRSAGEVCLGRSQLFLLFLLHTLLLIRWLLFHSIDARQISSTA
eukprot:SAG31_NODE_20958_length_561_cov_0.677489_1_plen_76_part_01